MNQLLSFIKKEFWHIVRDPMTLLIVFCLPVVMLVMFGFALTTEVKNSRFAIYDPINTQQTRQLAERLASNPYFIFARNLKAPSELEPAFESGEISLALLFGESALELVADGSDPNTAQTLVQYASAIISSGEGTVPPIRTELKLLYNPGMKGAYNFVPGVMGMVLMLVCAMMTSISIAREKELGTMELLLVSPLRPIKIILAKTVPYFLLSVLDLALILLLSVYVLGVPIAGSLPCLLMLCAIYIFLSLALGLLISTVVGSQVVALLISGMALMMPVVMLSGMMFPIENMPLPLRLLAQLVPAKWFIPAVKKIMLKGLGFSAVVQELAVLGAMGLFLMAVALKKQKVRLE